MPAVKRSAQAKAPAAKRMKTALEKNIDKVMNAITDAEAVVPCRDMFFAVAETLLKTPKSERHQDHTAVMDMMREVFMAEKARWEGRIAEAQAITDTVEQERTEKMSARDEEDAKVKAQKEVVKDKKHACEKAEEVLESSKEALAAAKKTLAAATKKKMKIVSEHDEAVGIQKSFQVLTEGSCDVPKEIKMHLALITSFFKTLDVEDALVKTIPTALGRKPSERGSFDEISLKQIQEHLENHLTGLLGKIEAAQVYVSDADCAITAWGAAVDLAQEKLEDCRVAEEASEAEQGSLQEALAAARKVLKDQNVVCKRKAEFLSAEQAGLGKNEAILNSLDFLSEYEVPAPAPEEVIEENKDQSVAETVTKEMPCDDVPKEVPSPCKARASTIESF